MLILDIETVPLPASLRAEYPASERTPPANYKSDEAIAKWRETDRKRWSEERAKQCSLNPRLGRILCVGTSEGVAYAETPEQELAALQQTWAWLREHGGKVCTWNGAFDLRFLLIRTMVHGLVPSLPSNITSEWFRRYTTYPHFDCKAVLLNWDVRVAGEGLNEWAQCLGVPGKTGGLSGADVYPLYCGGMHDEIKEYCLQDVAATAAIYERIALYF